MKFSWKKEAKPEVLIAKIKGIRSIGKRGVSYSGFEYHEYIGTLSSMLKCPADTSAEAATSFVASGISKAFQTEDVTPELVLREVNRSLGAYRSKSESTFELVTSVNVRFSGPKSLRLSGANVRFTRTLPKKFRSGRMEAFAHVKSWLAAGDDERGSFAIIKVSARSESEAADKALFSLDLLRSFWNFALNNSFSIRFGGRKKPINKVLLGPLHTLHKNDGSIATQTYWYETNSASFDTSIWKKEDLEKIDKFTLLLRKRLSQSMHKAFLEVAFVKLGRALDSEDYSACFTKLWGLLEHLTGTLNEKYEKTIRRTAFLYDDYDYSVAVLRQLKDSRNSYVHLATESPELEVQIYQLQSYVRQMIKFILFNSLGFESLSETYEFLDLPNDTERLRERINVQKKGLRFLCK